MTSLDNQWKICKETLLLSSRESVHAEAVREFVALVQSSQPLDPIPWEDRTDQDISTEQNQEFYFDNPGDFENVSVITPTGKLLREQVRAEAIRIFVQRQQGQSTQRSQTATNPQYAKSPSKVSSSQIRNTPRATIVSPTPRLSREQARTEAVRIFVQSQQAQHS
ncbi:hypothetical protein NADFUDRAFT_82535 [Nadsonia fulvescens var. elongata DSM 6958]|uniref:Uncharacterized protein n=1 Tax=Nadsonia fulvescens var. elongata DSM 6958 TaxID=857566 RepID=A0A1E3PPR9_9ASCO|nr:hypothetical protein NADFUDRAFT_82535 [Nadsonia fulvescens var. elongata DSM 6958]